MATTNRLSANKTRKNKGKRYGKKTKFEKGIAETRPNEKKFINISHVNKVNDCRRIKRV